MSDGTTNGPEMGLGSLSPTRISKGGEQQSAQSENLQEKIGIPLFETSDAKKVFIPRKPSIPLEEGLQIQVSSEDDSEDSPRDVLKRYLLALAAGKVEAESGLTKGAWANTRIEQGQKVSAYERIPEVEASWRKPVDTNSRNVGDLTNLEGYDVEKMQKLFRRYMPKWESLLREIKLFKNGVGGIFSYVTPEMMKDGKNNQDIVIWQSEKCKVRIVGGPHLNGFHLIVDPVKDFERQWQTMERKMIVDKEGKEKETTEPTATYIQATLEATAVAMGIQALLAPGRGEIHNSGNWAGGLKLTAEGGKLDLQNLQENRKAEKKSHRADIAAEDQKFGTSMHVHVYIPQEGEKVVLPPMSKGEAEERIRRAQGMGMPTEEYEKIIAQWDSIPNPTVEQYEEINNKLGGAKLTTWLEENVQGPLVQKV